jgi:hypothetical protein
MAFLVLATAKLGKDESVEEKQKKKFINHRTRIVISHLSCVKQHNKRCVIIVNIRKPNF